MSEPIFKSIFGTSWNQLPGVMKKHYANRPYTNDETVVEGRLNVICKAPLIWISWLIKFFGQIPPFTERDVPCKVQFNSNPQNAFFCFNRIFYFRNSQPYRFQSKMRQLRHSEVIEVMRFRFTWKMHYSWDGQKVILDHRGYGLYLLGNYIPLPLTWLLGRGYAEEQAIDENTFKMITHITHPWWGRIYQYDGVFEVKN